MVKANINAGLKRLMESYKPRVSEDCVLKFLRDKGFDTSKDEVKNYAWGVAEYLSYPENDDYDLETWYKDTWDNYPEDFENMPRLDEEKKNESLEENDYFDFVHELSSAVKACAKKWQRRGISAADVIKALDELSLRFEDVPEDFEESLNKEK